MMELLFVLVIMFVAYIFCCALSNKPNGQSSAPITKPEQTDKVNSKPVVEQPAPKPEPEKVVKPAATKAKTTVAKKGLKHPNTGEIVTNYSNYIFAKRWIKEALVTEGLLDKIYKNNEITTEVEARIKTAITELESMDKYKV